MAERKTQENNSSVSVFLNNIDNDVKRKDSKTVVKLMKSISQKPPKMWGSSIIGFDKHYYKYASGKDADICKIGFSPRAQSLVFYLGNFAERKELLGHLGKHKLSKGGCLSINKLEDIDLSVLEKIIRKAYQHKKAAGS